MRNRSATIARAALIALALTIAGVGVAEARESGRTATRQCPPPPTSPGICTTEPECQTWCDGVWGTGVTAGLCDGAANCCICYVL